MDTEPISTTISKIHRQNKEIYQHKISGTRKSSYNLLAGNVSKLMLTFTLLLSNSSRRFYYQFWLVAKPVKKN